LTLAPPLAATPPPAASKNFIALAVSAALTAPTSCSPFWSATPRPAVAALATALPLFVFLLRTFVAKKYITCTYSLFQLPLTILPSASRTQPTPKMTDSDSNANPASPAPPPAPAANAYEYYAFISYSSRDEVAAEQLQHVVQHYHLPVAIRKEPPNISPQVGIEKIPPKISPVFLYKKDMGPGTLPVLIQNALAASRYLLVVCSPNSAQSAWVGREIAFFAETLGRADRIIPVIIAGTPDDSDPAKRCFHPELLRLLPDERGINLSELVDAKKGILPRKKKTVQDEHGNPVAELFEAEQFYAQIVAKMLGIDWRKLYDFRKKEEKRRFKKTLRCLRLCRNCLSPHCLWHLGLQPRKI
jgi:hypothetical protein